MSGVVAALFRDAKYDRTENAQGTASIGDRQMATLLHNAALIYSIAMAALLAITQTSDRLIARFVPARRRRQNSSGAMRRPGRPTRWSGI